MPSSFQFLNRSTECRLYIHVARLHQNDGDVDLAAESVSTAKRHLESARSAMNADPHSEELAVFRELELHLADLDAWAAHGGGPVEANPQQTALTPDCREDSVNAGTGRAAWAKVGILLLEIRQRIAGMMTSIRRLRAGL